MEPIGRSTPTLLGVLRRRVVERDRRAGRRGVASQASLRRRAARRRPRARRALDVAAAGPFRVVARIVRECVHFVGDFHVPLLWLACEPMFVPAVAASAAMLTCNHADAKRPFPHLARDDELRCYVGRHGNLMFVGVLTALVLPCVATWFGVRVAPRRRPAPGNCRTLSRYASALDGSPPCFQSRKARWT